MSKGPICVTTFAQASGEGTPMFSRPGKATIAEYLAFKEPHEKIEEDVTGEEGQTDLEKLQTNRVAIAALLKKQHDEFNDEKRKALEKTQAKKKK